MKRLSIALAACCLTATALAADTSATGGDEQAIRQRMSSFVDSWNKHDPQAMASAWAEDGTLINPFGRVANNRAEVTQLFTDEQAHALKSSHMALKTMKVSIVKPDVAFIDADMDLTGMRAPDDKVLPPTHPHISALMTKNNGTWQIEDGRAFDFAPKPAGRAMGRTP